MILFLIFLPLAIFYIWGCLLNHLLREEEEDEFIERMREIRYQEDPNSHDS